MKNDNYIYFIQPLYIEHTLTTTSGKTQHHEKWDLTSSHSALAHECLPREEARHTQTYSKTLTTTLCFHTHQSVNSLIKLISVVEIKNKFDHSAGSHRGRSAFPEKHRQLVSPWRKPPADWWPKHYLGSLSNFVILELNLGVVFSQSSANPIRDRRQKKGKEQWVNI